MSALTYSICRSSIAVFKFLARKSCCFALVCCSPSSLPSPHYPPPFCPFHLSPTLSSPLQSCALCLATPDRTLPTSSSSLSSLCASAYRWACHAPSCRVSTRAQLIWHVAWLSCLCFFPLFLRLLSSVSLLLAPGRLSAQCLLSSTLKRPQQCTAYSTFPSHCMIVHHVHVIKFVHSSNTHFSHPLFASMPVSLQLQALECQLALTGIGRGTSFAS